MPSAVQKLLTDCKQSSDTLFGYFLLVVDSEGYIVKLGVYEQPVTLACHTAGTKHARSRYLKTKLPTKLMWCQFDAESMLIQDYKFLINYW